MIRAGLATVPIPGELLRGDLQLPGQPGHRHRRRRGHLIWHEPQPRQGTKLYRQPKAIPWRASPPGIHESLIRRRQREKPDELITGDLRETTQLASSCFENTRVAIEAP